MVHKTVTNAKAKVRFSLNVKLFRPVGNTPIGSGLQIR